MKLKKNKFIIGLSTTVLGSALAAGSQVAYADETVDISSSQPTGVNEISEPSEVNFAEVRDGSDLGGDQKSVETPSENDPQTESVDEAKLDTPAEDTQSSTEEKGQTSSDANDAVPTNETEENPTSVTEEDSSAKEEAGAESSSDSESTSEEAVSNEPETNDKESGEAEPVAKSDETLDANETGVSQEDKETTDTASTEAETLADTVDEASTEKAQASEENTEDINKKETADVANTEQKDDEKTSADAPQEIPAGEGPDATTIAKLSEEQIGKVENPLETDANVASTNDVVTEDDPLTGENDTADGSGDGKANNDLEEESIKEGKEPKFQTFAAGDGNIDPKSDQELAKNSDSSKEKDKFDQIIRDENTNIIQELGGLYYTAKHNEDPLEGVQYFINKENDTFNLVAKISRNDTDRLYENISIRQFYFGNEFRRRKQDVQLFDTESLRFLDVGEETGLGYVTYKPNEDVKFEPNDVGNITAIDHKLGTETLDEINKAEETIVGISGRFSPGIAETIQNKFLNVNHGIEFYVSPYPNENAMGEKILIDESNKKENLYIENGEVDTGIRLVNALEDTHIYDPYGEVEITDRNGSDLVIENDYDRVTGRVYDKNDEEIEDIDVFYDRESDSFKLRLPDGALDSEDSRFNSDYKNLDELKIRFYMAPRSSTSDTGIGRYDHYNQIGDSSDDKVSTTLTLDDQNNYDIITKDLSNDTVITDKIIKLTSGKEKTVQQTDNPDRDAPNSYEEAKQNGVADSYLEPEFENILIPVEGSENTFRTKDNWLVEVDPDNPENVKVTTPIGAKKGESLTLPVTYKFTNGSEKNFLLNFSVTEESIEKPVYGISETQAGESVENTPTNDDSEEKPKPTKYELESNTIQDSKGKTWTLEIDENTGVITATAPGEIDNLSTIKVPVIATYEDPNLTDANGNKLVYTENTDATFSATAPQEGEVTFTQEEPIPFETEVRYNPEKDPTETGIVEKGENGKVTVEYSVTYKDGKISEGPTKIKEVEGTKVEPKKQVIEIGTKKPAYEDQNIPFKTTSRETDDLLEGEEEILQSGEVGIKRVYEDGSEEIIKDPVNEIKLIGTRKEQAWTPIEDIAKPTYKDQEIEFKTTIRETDDLPEGEEEILQEGVVGIKRVYNDGTVEVIKEPINEIKLVGIKSIHSDPNANIEEVELDTIYEVDYNLDADEEVVIDEGTPAIYLIDEDGNRLRTLNPGRPRRVKVGIDNVEPEVRPELPELKVVEEDLNVIRIPDDTLAEGEEVVDQEGETAVYLVDENGEKILPALREGTPRKVRYGTKKPAVPATGTFTRSEKIPFGRQIIEDANLAAGTYKIVQEGKAGSKEITYTLEDGKVISEKLVSEVPAQDLIIHIGTKKTSSTDKPTVPSKPAEPTIKKIISEIPYDTVFIYDNTIEAGKKVVTSPGQKGEKIVTITSKLVDGKIVTQTTEEIIKQPKTEFVRVGTRAPQYNGEDVVTKESKVLIPFETEIIYDENLPLGETVVVSEGRDGIQVITITTRYENGVAIETTTDGYVLREAINRVVRVGTKSNTNRPTIDEDSGIIDIPANTDDNDHIIVIPEGTIDDNDHVVVVIPETEDTTDDSIENESPQTDDEREANTDIEESDETERTDISREAGRTDDEKELGSDYFRNEDQVVKGTKNIKVSEDNANAVNIKRSAVSSTNPKTGITGTAGIISTLGISLAGLTASRKKKENDEE